MLNWKNSPTGDFIAMSFAHATHLIEVETPVESVMDWGMLAISSGEAVEENIPVLTGAIRLADPLRHKHLGAAAAFLGRHRNVSIVGVTPEASSLETHSAGAAGGHDQIRSARAPPAFTKNAEWERSQRGLSIM